MSLHSVRQSAALSRTSFRLRSHQAGDIGWVISRHGALYAEQFGWDIRFEALVARIGADFIDEFQPDCERAWIVERDGVRVGSVFIVKKSKTIAKLRLLLIEPEARGIGLGRRLVDECIGFARARGYRKIQLWTQRNLKAARAIYQRAGFILTASEPHVSFGKRLVGETWELRL